MKRLILSLSIILALAASLSPAAWSQATITTRKYRLADFPSKTTKMVVERGNFLEESLMEEIQGRWRVSPFEFCGAQEYQDLKSDPNYYFLVCSKVILKGQSEPSMYTLSMVKGGDPQDEDQQKRPMDILEIPLCPVNCMSGRELVYLPAIIDIIQDFMEKAMTSDADAYAGLTSYNKNVMTRLRGKDIMIADCDFVNDASKHSDKYKSIRIVSEEEANSSFEAGSPGVVTSYVVAPDGYKAGSTYYLMLIDAGSHELYYYGKRKAKTDSDAGFHEADLKLLSPKLKKK